MGQAHSGIMQNDYFTNDNGPNLIPDILSGRRYVLDPELSSRLERVYRTNGVPYSYFIAGADNPPKLGNRWFPKNDAWRVFAERGDLRLIEVGLEKRDFDHPSNNQSCYNSHPSQYWPLSTKEGGVVREGGILRINSHPDLNEHLLRVSATFGMKLGNLLNLMGIKNQPRQDSLQRIKALYETLELAKNRLLDGTFYLQARIEQLNKNDCGLSLGIDISPERVAQETFPGDLKTLLEKGQDILVQLEEDSIFRDLYIITHKQIQRRDLYLAIDKSGFIPPELTELISLDDGNATSDLRTAIGKLKQLLDDHKYSTKSEGNDELVAFVDSVNRNTDYQALLRAI